MNIRETEFRWNGNLQSRGCTERIVLHHRGGSGDVQSIHNQHVKQGYTGIGYHFYVRKDGSIYRGRPQNTIGAHCIGFNSSSVGVCFEGNFENEKMPYEQKTAGAYLVKYLKSVYKNARVMAHNELIATACPGKNFPFNDIALNTADTSGTSGTSGTSSTSSTSGKKDENTERQANQSQPLQSANDITWELSQKIAIEDVDGFVAALELAKKNNSPLYWGFYKVVNSGL